MTYFNGYKKIYLNKFKSHLKQKWKNNDSKMDPTLKKYV